MSTCLDMHHSGMEIDSEQRVRDVQWQGLSIDSFNLLPNILKYWFLIHGGSQFCVAFPFIQSSSKGNFGFSVITDFTKGLPTN